MSDFEERANEEATGTHGGRCRITMRLLREVLHFPENARIVSVETPQEGRWEGWCDVYVESPDLPKIDEGHPAKELYPTYITEYNIKEVKFAGWGI